MEWSACRCVGVFEENDVDLSQTIVGELQVVTVDLLQTLA